MSSGEPIRALLTTHFGDACVRQMDYGHGGFHLRLTMENEQCRELAEVLYNNDYYLEYLTAVDRLDHLELIYVFGRYEVLHRIQAVVRVPKGEKVMSISQVFLAADWHEREVYDLFGQVFTDHPNLKRILLPEDADYYPLLKDFRAPPRLGGDTGPRRQLGPQKP